MFELATGQLIAGSSRLASGVFQLVLLALGIVAGAQLVGVPASAVGGALSAFFGALAMTPVAVLLARQGFGPATLVTFFPGFWILVPGALGLEGVTRILGEDSSAPTGALTTTVTSMIGIALGVLLGLALSAPDPERPWTSGNRPRRWPHRG